MSLVTNAIFKSGVSESEALDKINESLATNGIEGAFVGVRKHAGGPKYMECDVALAAFNYVSKERLITAVNEVKWQWPEEVQLMLQEQGEDRFTIVVDGVGRGTFDQLFDSVVEGLMEYYPNDLKDPKVVKALRDRLSPEQEDVNLQTSYETIKARLEGMLQMHGSKPKDAS